MSIREIKVVQMQPSDISDIKQIEKECGLSMWRTEDYLSEIGRTDSFCKVAAAKGEIAGFILARLITTSDVKSDNCAEIYNIAVGNLWRKRGIGKKLISDFIDFCRKHEIKEIFLEVRKANETARRFYLKTGFQAIAERKNYYNLPTDNAVIMKCELSNVAENENFKT